MGETASGKTGFGIELAKYFDGEIISADSRQIYKGLDLASGKATLEEQSIVPHHLLDVLPMNVRYSSAQFKKDCEQKIEEIFARGKLPIIVGGTGYYIRSVTEGYGFDEARRFDIDASLPPSHQDGEYCIHAISSQKRSTCLNANLATPHQHQKETHKNEPKYEALNIVVSYPKDILNERILIRLDERIKDGMIKEIKDLIANGADEEFLISLGLECRYTTKHLKGEYSFDEFREVLFTRIKQFAKRQRTWLRKEKNTLNLDMTNKDSFNQAIKAIEEFLK